MRHGVSVQRYLYPGGLYPGNLCPVVSVPGSLSGQRERRSLSRSVSVQGVSIHGVSVQWSLSRGLSLDRGRGGLCLGVSLSRGVSVQGVSVNGDRMSLGGCVQEASVRGSLFRGDLCQGE